MKSKYNNNSPIVVHAPNWVGDHAMAFPFYLTLRELFPDYPKILLGRYWISSLVPDGIFDEIIIADKNKSFVKSFKEKRPKKPFLAVSLSPSFRSALTLHKLQPELLIGYKTDYRNFLLKYPPARGSQRIPPLHIHEHRALSYIRLLTPFFPNNQTAENYFAEFAHYTWRFPIKKKEKEHLEELKKSHKIVSKSILLCPGSVAPSKIYPVEHLVQLIEIIFFRKLASEILLVGSHIEKPFAEKILSFLPEKLRPKVKNITTQTSLNELIHLMREAKAVVANDSGVAHLTSLAQVPLVSFQGMGRKDETVPLNYQKQILHKQLSCSPCMKKHCPRVTEKLKCLKDITPEEVADSLEKLL